MAALSVECELGQVFRASEVRRLTSTELASSLAFFMPRSSSSCRRGEKAASSFKVAPSRRGEGAGHTVSPHAAADGGDGEPFGASGVGAGSTDLAKLGAGSSCSAFVADPACVRTHAEIFMGRWPSRRARARARARPRSGD